MCWKILPNILQLAPAKLIFVCVLPFLVDELYSLESCDLEHSLSEMLVEKSISMSNSIDVNNGYKKTLLSHQSRQKSPPINPLQIYNMALQKVKHSQRESNVNITKAIALERDAMNIFCHLLKEPKANTLLKIVAGRECVKLCKNYHQHDALIEALGWLRFELPDHPNIWLHHATLLFTSGQPNDAMSSLRKFHLQWPQDRRGFCLQELGARLQACSRETSATLFHGSTTIKDRPNQSDACKAGTLGIFGFMANSFRRNGSLALAEIVFEQGYQLGFYPTKWQRSSALRHQCLNLKSQPLWKIEDVSSSIGLQEIRNHWRIIRTEAEVAFSLGVFDDEQENLVQEGLWQQLVLFENGQKVMGGCSKAPKTCQIVGSFPELLSTRRGQIKFSLLQPGTWIHPHTGPTNCRLRAHLGLKVPPATRGEVVLRIAEDRVNWQEGEFLIIDDSFEHEVYNNSTEARLILLIDFWHPGLSEEDKFSLEWDQADPNPPSSEEDDSLISIAGLASKIKTIIPYIMSPFFI